MKALKSKPSSTLWEEIRQALGYPSIARLAIAYKIPLNRIYDWKNGKRCPYTKNLARLRELAEDIRKVNPRLAEEFEGWLEGVEKEIKKRREKRRKTRLPLFRPMKEWLDKCLKEFGLETIAQLQDLLGIEYQSLRYFLLNPFLPRGWHAVLKLLLKEKKYELIEDLLNLQ